MARNTSNLKRKNAVLPASFTSFLRNRAIEGIGITLIFAAFGIIIALFNYSPADPSFNAASSTNGENFFGTVGAWIADLLMQLTGLASWALPIISLTWGWRIVKHRTLGRLWLRLVSLPIAIITIALSLAGIGTGPSWELQAGYGGVIGDMTLAATTNLTSSTEFHGPNIIIVIALILSCVTLISAFGFTATEWQKFKSFLRWLSQHSSTASVAGKRAGIRAGRWSLKIAKKSQAAAQNRLEPNLRGERAIGDSLDVHANNKLNTRNKKQEPTLGPNGRETKKEIVAPRATKVKPGKKAEAARQTSLELGSASEYELPRLDLLETIVTEDKSSKSDEDALAENARLLESVLEDFGVQGEIIKVRPGPVVTLYEFEPAPGIKSSRIIGLSDDIARSMSAISARVAVVQGRNAIGIELPNATREIVSLRELIESEKLEKNSAKLSLALGKDIGGAPTIADLARMPHLLIAGTTGSGKSVAINTMIISLLYRLSPEHCRLVMIDPKMLELSVYDGIPHLLCPVVTDPKKAVVALRWTVREMEQRYRAMSTLGVRNIAGYNARIEEAHKKGETLTRTVQTGFDSETGEPIYEDQPLDMSPLPYIVVIVDEMADLMLVAGKEVESSVQRIAQMARAAGIHLIMATQRPSVDVITGTIKANFPTRISFQVTSKIDSRTILGEAGAEQLLGQGDMLFMAGGGRISRVHGPLVTDEEVERVVTALKTQGMPKYIEEVTREDLGNTVGEGGDETSPNDALYDQAVALVCKERKASTSFVQRHLSIGYNRAARIVDQMETEGVISSANHVGKREVLAPDIENREQQF